MTTDAVLLAATGVRLSTNTWNIIDQSRHMRELKKNEAGLGRNSRFLGRMLRSRRDLNLTHLGAR